MNSTKKVPINISDQNRRAHDAAYAIVSETGTAIADLDLEVLREAIIERMRTPRKHDDDFASEIRDMSRLMSGKERALTLNEDLSIGPLAMSLTYLCALRHMPSSSLEWDSEHTSAAIYLVAMGILLVACASAVTASPVVASFAGIVIGMTAAGWMLVQAITSSRSIISKILLYTTSILMLFEVVLAIYWLMVRIGR